MNTPYFLRIAALSSLLLASPLAFGATFYVNATSGSDMSTGLTTDHAWKTLAKVSAAKFAPGDSILLARNEIWREQLIVPSSGQAKARLTIGAYGFGAQPMIAGSDTLSGWRFVSGATYAAKVSTSPTNLYDGDAGLQSVPMLKHPTRSEVDGTPGSWCFDKAKETVYVQLADQSNPDTHSVAAAVRKFGIYSANHSFVSVHDIAVKEVTQAAIYFCNVSPPTGTVGTNYDNNFNEYNTIERCTLRNFGGLISWDGGIYVRGSTGPGPKPMLRGWRILSNTVGRIENPPVIDYDRAGIEVRGTVGAVVSYNNVATVNKYAIRVCADFAGQTSASPTVSHNTITHSFCNIAIADTDDATVTHNVIFDSAGMGIGIGHSSNALVAYNLIYNLTESDDMTLYNGIDINAGALNGRAYHNTVARVASACLTLEGDNNTPSQGWIVENNIFDGRRNYESIANQHSVVYIAGDVTQFKFAHNLYADTVKHAAKAFQFPIGVYSPFSAFGPFTNDTTSRFVTDPQFVGRNDFHLKDTSRAVGLGEAISGIEQAVVGTSIDCGVFPFVDIVY
ncbi:MAG TPA: right-handed parallel beta-helix repeat-containing protein [Capsulimonadaceae bacterium]|jgi:hypothetical protein